MSEITDLYDIEEAKDMSFYGKRVEDMSRDELLAMIKHLSDRKDELDERYVQATDTVVQLMDDMSSMA